DPVRLPGPATVRAERGRSLTLAPLQRIDGGMDRRCRLEGPDRRPEYHEVETVYIDQSRFHRCFLLSPGPLAPDKEPGKAGVFRRIVDLDQLPIAGCGKVLGNMAGVAGLAVVNDADLHQI